MPASFVVEETVGLVAKGASTSISHPFTGVTAVQDPNDSFRYTAIGTRHRKIVLTSEPTGNYSLDPVDFSASATYGSAIGGAYPQSVNCWYSVQVYWPRLHFDGFYPPTAPGGPHSIMIGQQARFRVSSMPESSSVTWTPPTLGRPIKPSYQIGNVESVAPAEMGSQIAGSELICYFTEGRDGAGIAFEVTWPPSWNVGTSSYVGANFNVVAPTFREEFDPLFGIATSSAVVNSEVSPGLGVNYVAAVDPPNPAGAFWHVGATTPLPFRNTTNYLTADKHGEFAYVQVMRPGHRRVLDGVSQVWSQNSNVRFPNDATARALDGQFPAYGYAWLADGQGPVPDLNDKPHVSFSGGVSTLECKNEFEMYLMYKPPGQPYLSGPYYPRAWIPLRVYRWRWNSYLGRTGPIVGGYPLMEIDSSRESTGLNLLGGLEDYPLPVYWKYKVLAETDYQWQSE